MVVNVDVDVYICRLYVVPISSLLEIQKILSQQSQPVDKPSKTKDRQSSHRKHELQRLALNVR